MGNLPKRYPVWVSVVLTLLFPLASLLAAVPLLLLDGLWAQGDYLPQLLAELAALAVMGLAAWLLGFRDSFRSRGTSLGEKLMPCLAILALYTFSLLETLILEMEHPPEPPLRILWYVLCMLAVGLAEELTFRGLITRMIYEKYGKSYLGLWLSVLISSLLFGLVHLTNAAGAEVSGVLIQVVGAAALGICLSAIYLRSGSLWTVVLLHAYMDFCALAASGLFGTEDITDLVGQYDGANLISAALYTVLGIFLLRPSKTKRLTEPGAEGSSGQVLMLMAALALLSGLFTAVTVMSV